jgi:hypothetical protein
MSWMQPLWEALQMNPDLKEYLQSIDEYMVAHNMRTCLYKKEGRKLELVMKSNKRSDINAYLKTIGNVTGKYVVIQYQINTGKFFKGPMDITCEIHEYKNGKSIADTATMVYYLLTELETRGFKWGDYKRIFNKLDRGLIPQLEPGKFLLPTISDVD